MPNFINQGNALVIMDKEEYNKRLKLTKIKRNFKKLPRNPLPKILENARNIINKTSDFKCQSGNLPCRIR